MSRKDKICVKNFGPIGQAEIDISPLTIFVGKNSSGKSFLSLLLHCLSNPFEDINSKYNSRRFLEYSYNFLIENNGELFDGFENALNEYIETEPSINSEPFIFPKEDFDRLFNEGFVKCYTKLIERKLRNSWKTDLNNLNRLKVNPFEISFNNNIFFNESGQLVNKNFEYFPLKFAITDDNKSVADVEYANELKVNLNHRLWVKLYGDEGISLAQVIYLVCIDKLIGKLKSIIFYIPAGGEIFKDFDYFLYNELNGENNSSNVEKEFISNLLMINKGTEKGYFYDLAVEMENEINGGEIHLKSGDLKDELVFTDNKNNLELELNLVSSSIRELIPIIMYLKYHVNKGDTLIIEEMEKHLHPENQIILVKYLVKAINKGLKIILTTHSDFIIEKFNNFIRLGNSSKISFEELGYDETCILNHENVSIYNFVKNDDYSFTTKEIEINFTGFNNDSFDHVINELYDESGIIIDNKLR